MNKSARYIVALSILALGSGALLPSAWAERTEPIKLDMVVQKEITVTDETGATKVELVEPKLVVPGDEVIYTISYMNLGKEPATAIVVTNQIPDQMIYVPDTAGGANVSVLFSADGAEFVARSLVRVRTPEGDLRPAEDQDLTHIRWVVNADVLPGKGGTVAYRARLQ